MSANKEINRFAGYQRTAEKMAAFTSAMNHPDLSQLTEEQQQDLLDACDHSRSSYAEEALAQDLRKLREQFEQSQKENDENLRKQQEQHDIEWQAQIRENRFNRVCNVIAILIAAASMVISLLR